MSLLISVVYISFSWIKFVELTFLVLYFSVYSDSGQMCDIKEVKVVGHDQSSKESLEQLNRYKHHRFGGVMLYKNFIFNFHYTLNGLQCA